MYRTGLANGVMSCDIRCARPVQVQCNVMVWGSGSVMIRSLWSMSHVRNKIRIEARMERMPSLVRSNPLGIGDGVPDALGIQPSRSNPRARTLGIELVARAGGFCDTVDVLDSRERYVRSRTFTSRYVMLTTLMNSGETWRAQRLSLHHPRRSLGVGLSVPHVSPPHIAVPHHRAPP